MAITVQKLYKNGAFLYKMKLVAGRDGLDHLVKWIHIIEDVEVSSFLHGNELVFTAGILNKDPGWLLRFSKDLREAGVSAFVVNIGPHTKEIPKEVVSYCNEVSMPLFTIPWETRMVDMTRDFCYRIMNNENVENNTASTIKNIIYNIGDIDTQVMQMERYGFQRDDHFCFISILLGDGGVENTDNIKNRIALIAERIARRTQDLFIRFAYKEYIILVLVNYTQEEISDFESEFIQFALLETKSVPMHMGISSNQIGMYNQKDNFEKALSAMEMAKKRNKICDYYDKMGIYKVLYAVGDKTVLRDFYRSVVGKLERYDRQNDSSLTNMLKTYLENNGSLQIAAEKQFVHRNTVTNQMKKIEEITGYNPLNLKDKVELSLAFLIKNIL